MKKYFLSFIASVLALAICMPLATAQYDDMYYDPEQDDNYFEYKDDFYEDEEDGIADSDYYYYDGDYNDSYYSNRIRRFRRSNVALSYYDPFYTSFYSPIIVPRTSLFVSVGYRPIGYSNFYDYLAWRDYSRYRNGFGNYYYPSFGYGGTFGRTYGGGFLGAGAGAYNPYCPPGSYSTGRFVTATTPVAVNNNRRTYTTSARTRATTTTRTATTRVASPGSRTSRTYKNPRSSGNTRAGTPATRSTTRATRGKSGTQTRARTAPRTRTSTAPRTRTSTAPKRTYTPKRSGGNTSVKRSGLTSRPSVTRSTSSSTRRATTRSSSTRSSTKRSGNNK